MAISRVWVEDTCVACGLSEVNCPEVFKVETIGDDMRATVKKDVDLVAFESKIKDAVKGCPVDAIKYEES